MSETTTIFCFPVLLRNYFPFCFMLRVLIFGEGGREGFFLAPSFLLGA